MNHYYVEINGSPTKMSRELFTNHIAKLLAEDFDQETASAAWVTSGISVVESGQDPGLDDDDHIKAFEIVKDLVKDSERIAKQVAQGKEVKSAKKVLEEQKDLQNAQEAVVALRQETSNAITLRIQNLVGENFDVTSSGGLVLKKDAKLTREDGYTLIGGLVEMVGSGERMQAVSSLALGDALVETERKFGESLDYTQLIDQTGKSESLLRAARMVSQQFPAKNRADIDKEGNLGFSHWQEVSGRKGLSPKVKTQIASFAAKRGSTSTSIRELAKTIELIPEKDRESYMDTLNEKAPSAAVAVEILKKDLENHGESTGDKASWLFVQFGGSTPVLSSNEYNRLLQGDGLAIKLGAKPKITYDGIEFRDIQFLRTAPDTLPDDAKVPVEAPESPVVASEEESDTKTPEKEEIEYYGVFRISKADGGGFKAEGTIDGAAKKIPSISAHGERDAMNKLEVHFALSEEDGVLYDEEGRPWQLLGEKE